MAKNSRIFVRLHGNGNWRALSAENCIESIEPVSSPFRLKLTEAIYIVWKKLSLNKQLKHASKPSLNKQIKHASITITLNPSFIFTFYFHFTVSFSFIPSSVLLSLLDLVFRCILNSICNHSKSVKYYFIVKCLIDTLIKIFNNSFKLCLKFIQLMTEDDTAEMISFSQTCFMGIKYDEI